MNPDSGFWNRRQGWEPVPRRKLAVVTASVAVLLGSLGIASAVLPTGEDDRQATHAESQHAGGRAGIEVDAVPGEAPVVLAPVAATDGDVLAPPADPVAGKPPAPAPAPASARPSTVSSGSSVGSASGAPAPSPVGGTSATTTAPAPAPAPAPTPTTSPPPEEPSCVVNLLGVCVQL